MNNRYLAALGAALLLALPLSAQAEATAELVGRQGKIAHGDVGTIYAAKGAALLLAVEGADGHDAETAA